MPTEVLIHSIELAPAKKDVFSTLVLFIFALIFALALVAAFVQPTSPSEDGAIVVSGP